MLLKSSLWVFLLMLIVSCSTRNETILQDSLEESSTKDTTQVVLSISVPKNSGLAFVDYRRYTIVNDTLFVIDRLFRSPFPDTVWTEIYVSDTIEKYLINSKKTQELKQLISKTDSLGDHHSDGCLIQMGWPRFFINTSVDGDSMNGFLTNCYRKHIFQFVDFLNECYPKGDVISYEKEELIQTEKECEENNYGRMK